MYKICNTHINMDGYRETITRSRHPLPSLDLYDPSIQSIYNGPVALFCD